MRIVLYASLIGLILMPHAIAATPTEAFERAQGYVRQRQFAEAVAAAEAALRLAEISPADKARLLKVAAEATMGIGADHAEAAIELYERIVADPAIAMPARLDALRAIADVQIAGLAGQYLHEMDVSAAHRTLARGPSLPDLTPHDRATAFTNIGRLFEREHKGDEARRVYEQILSLDVNDSVKKQAHQRIAHTLIHDDKTDEALAIYRAQGLDLIEFHKLAGDNQSRQAECLRVLESSDAPEHVRWSAFSRLPCWDWQVKDFAGIRTVCDAYLSDFMESDANRAMILRSRVMNTAPAAEPAFIEWAAPILMKAPRLSDEDYVKVYAAMIEALVVQQKSSSAAAGAEAMSADQRISSERRLAASLTAAALIGNSDVQPILDAAADVSPSAQAEALLAGARAALTARDESTGRAFHAIYQELLASPDRASITCRFDTDAPFDIGSWLASPVHRNPSHRASLDRPYGSNLEFLLATDSAVTGRNVGSADEPAGDTRTDFHAVSDADGLHLFLFAYDSRVDDVLSGAATGGSFEIYLAPGNHQAYYTFLIDLPEGRVDPQAFITMYPNAHFRLPSIERGTMRAQTRAVDGGFATHLFLSWRLFHDRLPANGDRWHFEAIRWTRAGGFTFGGSQSVHNRSSWGDIVFEGMSDANLDMIRRRVMAHAAARYQAARRVTGAAGQWNDRELGDPEFHATHVKPLLDRLDAHAARLKDELTTEEAAMLYEQAVLGWMETGHLVDAMRAEYLTARHFDE